MSTQHAEPLPVPDLPLIIEDLLVEAEQSALRGDRVDALQLRDEARRLRRKLAASGTR